MRQSLYYLEDGLEQGLLLPLCELHFSLIVLLLLLPVTALDDKKLENHLHKYEENLLNMRGQRSHPFSGGQEASSGLGKDYF
jgi:hypothetical protein